MKNILALFAVVCLTSVCAVAQGGKAQGDVSQGGKVVRVSPTVSYNVVESFPNATITVYNTGTTTLTNIFSNSTGTVKSNPFTADSKGFYEFYVPDGIYDLRFSGIGIASPFTRTVSIRNNAVTSFNGRTGAIVSQAGDYLWSQINKSISSLADITTRNAGDLNAGTLPDARFPAILPPVDGSRLTNITSTAVLPNPLIYTGQYTKWSSTNARLYARNEPGVDLGGAYYMNHLFENARAGGGANDIGQFGLVSTINSGVGSGGWVVGLFSSATSPVSNTGTVSLYGANFNATIGSGSAWPDYTRGLEININNNKADVALREPAGPPGFNTITALEIASGGPYKADYGIRITASSPNGGGGFDNNKWRVGLRCGVDCFSFRGLELANPPVSQGAGLIVGQGILGFDTLNFARNDDSASTTSNFIRFRNAILTQDLFKIDWNGFVYSSGYFIGSNASTDPAIFKGTGSPEGIFSSPRGTIFIRTDGGAGTTLYVKETPVGTSTGWNPID